MDECLGGKETVCVERSLFGWTSCIYGRGGPSTGLQGGCSGLDSARWASTFFDTGRLDSANFSKYVNAASLDFE